MNFSKSRQIHRVSAFGAKKQLEMSVSIIRGEIEWERYEEALKNGILLPDDTVESLAGA